jgi:hypothetical protein
MSRVLFVVPFLLVLGACGGGASPGPASSAVSSSTPSSVQTLPTPTPRPIPPPPEGCEPWPLYMAELFAKLPLPDGLCLKYVSPSELNVGSGADYNAANRTVRMGVFPEFPVSQTGFSHELCHAHQHWAILQAGFPDQAPNDHNGPGYFIKYLLNTREGQEYMAATGYTFLGLGGECTRESLPVCYSVEVSKCEGFCNSTIPRMNPYEDNAEFCSFWYARDRTTLPRFYPRRVGWATVWLP